MPQVVVCHFHQLLIIAGKQPVDNAGLSHPCIGGDRLIILFFLRIPAHRKSKCPGLLFSILILCGVLGLHHQLRLIQAISRKLLFCRIVGNVIGKSQSHDGV